MHFPSVPVAAEPGRTLPAVVKFGLHSSQKLSCPMMEARLSTGAVINSAAVVNADVAVEHS